MCPTPWEESRFLSASHGDNQRLARPPPKTDRFAFTTATPLPQPISELASDGQITVPPLCTVPWRLVPFLKWNCQLPPTIVTEPSNMGCPVYLIRTVHAPSMVPVH